MGEISNNRPNVSLETNVLKTLESFKQSLPTILQWLISNINSVISKWGTCSLFLSLFF